MEWPREVTVSGQTHIRVGTATLGCPAAQLHRAATGAALGGRFRRRHAAVNRA